jgi:hypothetical protein
MDFLDEDLEKNQTKIRLIYRLFEIEYFAKISILFVLYFYDCFNGKRKGSKPPCISTGKFK